MNILALDLARQTGHAMNLPDGTIVSGSTSFASLIGQDASATFGKFITWLNVQIDSHDSEFVAYELIDWKIIGKDWRTMYLGMTGIIRGTCFNHRISTRGYPVRDIKFAATGKKSAGKPAMVSSARAQWPDQTIIDDNQADALWVLYLAMVSFDMPVMKHAGELF